MARKTDIVVTTIFEPTWMAGYLDNIRRHDRVDEVTLRIICDKKTPQTVYRAAEEARKAGFDVDCPTLDEQQAYVDSLGLPEGFIPWNTDNRRNIGFLRAWQHGAEVLISIDDDNYCRPDSDFVGEHHSVGVSPASLSGALWADAAPWFNICGLLKCNPESTVYARGYPYAARRADRQARIGALSSVAGQGVMAVNAGLWLDDPDVDALTRLAIAPRALSANPTAVILAPETWSPINTQNTALIREAVPAYYYIRMGYPLQGLKIDRFGDILSGYFVQKCAKHLGHGIRLGSPVADHRRTPHNLFKDLYHELAGVVLIEDLLPWLQELRLSGQDYAEVYAALADALEGQAERFKGFVWDEGGREFLRETASAMRQWLATIRVLA